MIQDLRYFLFGPAQDHYKVVILIKDSGLVKEEILKHYIHPIIAANPSLKESDFCALNLKYDGKSVKVAATAKPWINFLATLIKCDFIYVTDSTYYKILAGVRKTTYNFGYSVDCVLEPLKNAKVVLSVNYQSLYFNPKNQERINLANACVGLETQGKQYFKDIIKHEEYPTNLSDIDIFLSKLLQYDELACDIEAFSLNHTKAGIATIAFAWSQHEGGGFLVDYGVDAKTSNLIRLRLLEFFKAYLGAGKKLIWHNISYDAKVLIWELFMQTDWGKQTQLLEGLDLLNNPNTFEDTKIIAYLATNSCDGNELGLKQLALPFAGNYALEEIQDITKHEPKVVLKYNLIDSLSTFYVYNEYYSKMVADNQLNVYNTIFKPSVKVLTQAELHGMPLDMHSVLKAEKELTTILQDSLTEIGRNPYVILYEEFKVCDAYISQNLAWKKKYEPLSYFQDFSKTEIHSKTFKLNPNSSTQLSTLLFDLMDLPILDKTKKGQNATGAKTLKDLKNHTNDPDILNFLDALIKYNGAVKILDAFIPSFKNAYHNLDTNTHYLSGNFNLGGTVSGRLSCSNPNLQQIPSGSIYAKLIKKCFKAPKGKLIVGLDFNSLEDYISALTTKDPNKLKVYTDKYDGHCLRAFGYFPDRLPDIENTVESINSIKDKYPDVRQDSKAPTFALTYQGTWLTLMKNCGFSEKLAKQIESNFKKMYAVSVKYIEDILQKASETGYVEVAFGLRVRTHLIKKSLWGSSKTPKEATAEGRTAGNACGQSYGMLNNRAAIEFQERTLNSKFRERIWPIAHIHDAQYFVVDNNLELLSWMNKNLVECVQWQELPEIQHDEVKLGGELSVFYPDWSNELVIPNGMFDEQELKTYLETALEKSKR